ncbi:MAG: hypothetical protein ACRENE_14575 [Polyangiaceae bacterium]
MSVDLTPPPSPPAPQKAEVEWVRPIPASAYVAGAIALAGLADFAVAGSLGLAKQQELEGQHCSPFCSPSDVADAKTRYAVADIGLAVGVSALLTGAVLILARPSKPVASAQTERFGVELGPTGGVMRWEARF